MASSVTTREHRPMTSTPDFTPDADGVVWVELDEDFDEPRGARPYGYRLTYSPPGLPEETRTLVFDELGPADDRLAMKQAGGLTATELVSKPGVMMLCGVWWLGGKQDGKRETWRELEPLFSVAHIRNGGGSLEAGFVMPDDGGLVDDDEVDDDVDPTQGANT